MDGLRVVFVLNNNVTPEGRRGGGGAEAEGESGDSQKISGDLRQLRQGTERFRTGQGCAGGAEDPRSCHDIKRRSPFPYPVL